MFSKMPPKNDKVRMSRSPGSGKGGSGSALPPNTTSIMGGTRRADRTPGKGKSGSGSAMPPNTGPGSAPRTAKGKISHARSGYGT